MVKNMVRVLTSYRSNCSLCDSISQHYVCIYSDSSVGIRDDGISNQIEVHSSQTGCWSLYALPFVLPYNFCKYEDGILRNDAIALNVFIIIIICRLLPNLDEIGSQRDDIASSTFIELATEIKISSMNYSGLFSFLFSFDERKIKDRNALFTS